MGCRYKVGWMGKGQGKRRKVVGSISSAIKTKTLTFVLKEICQWVYNRDDTEEVTFIVILACSVVWAL